jgi:lysophospholipase L1-like esterase
VAREKNVPLVDVYARFQEYGEFTGQSVADLLLDGMHPNARGHQLIAEWIVEEWNEFVPAR